MSIELPKIYQLTPKDVRIMLLPVCSFILSIYIWGLYYLKIIDYNTERDVWLCMLYSKDTTNISPVWSERPKIWEAE